MNENSFMPMYYQLKDLIKDKIKNNEWKTDDRIPSESELIAQYGVTHHTVLKALNELAREGLIYTKKGTGRFVSPNKLIEKLEILESYTSSLKERNIEPDIRIIAKELITPDQYIARMLQLTEGEKVIKIERVSYIDDQPNVCLLSYIPYKIAPKLMDIDLQDKSIYELLKELYSIILMKAHNYIEANFAEEHISDMLNIKEGTMILVNEGIDFTGDDVPVEYTKIIYKGDRYKFYIESHKKD
jgi:GntR family transcriptional regulator